MFDLAIDSKLRGCDVVEMKIGSLGIDAEAAIALDVDLAAVLQAGA